VTVNGSLTVTGDTAVGGNNTVAGDSTVTGKLTVQGSYELSDCPSGYDVDPSAHPDIIVCVHPVRGDEMVKVGDFWVDRYEATVFQNPDCTGQTYGTTSDNWSLISGAFPEDGNWSTKYYACSVPGQYASRWITWLQAQAACAAVGKHLITNAEWQLAVEGTYDPGANDGSAGGACHTSGTGPRQTGNAGTIPGGTTSCVSSWGAEDMIGNYWEWTAKWWAVGAPPTGWTNGEMVQAWGPNYYNDGTWNMLAAASRPDVGVHVDGLPAASLRGGTWNNNIVAGAFAINVNPSAVIKGQQGGVRCARSR
jgi:formylglycine-generating enzyme required for sulfatase activity